MTLFYTENIQANQAELTEEEARHCTQVLRKKLGDSIYFIDGKGGFYEGEIIEIKKKTCILKIIKAEMEFEKRNFHLHMAIAPTKNINRLEWFLEKATEIGIDTISPILTFHSERKHIKVERLKRILTAAIKQSKKAYMPVLHELTTFDKFLKQFQNSDDQLFIAHCDGPVQHLKDVAEAGKNTTILIGPEGDFSAEEVIQAKAVGFREISLGKSRLRTETAGVVACHIVNLNND